MIHMPHRFNNPSGDSYRSLLTLLAQILSTPNAELHVKSKLVAGEPVERVKMFVDGNLQKRFEYVQFHNLDRSSGRRIATDAHIHLNPIRSWTRFLTSELLEDDVEPPVDVVFFPDQGQIATAAMDAAGHELFDYLDRTQPCTVREWAEAAGLQNDNLVVSLRGEFVDMGLAAGS